ncbi:MAG: hypothetical protein ACRDGI_06415 [Candidatus Limnocylindrales bacterium]
MIRVIRDHNKLNGLRFSAAEFTAVWVVGLGLALWFASAGAVLLAIAALGVAANAVPVVSLAVASIRAGEPDIGLRGMLHREVRAQALREVPTMQRDTYILAGASVLPFVVVGAVLLELRRHGPSPPRRADL